MFISSHIPRTTIIQILLHIVLISIVAVIIASCGPSDPQQDIISSSINDAYPVQIDPNANPPSSAQIDAYPAPTAPIGTLLALNKPIKVTDTKISGVGPAGLPITIVNITLMGEQLGTGMVENDGTFSIPVTLQSNIRIGISADIEAFGLTTEDVQPGKAAMNVPLVGYFFDTAVVSQD